VSPKREPRTAGSPVETAAEASELERLIDERLPLELRADYLRLKAGSLVVAPRRRQVPEAILDIMDDAGLPLDGLDHC
jgi:hypothetical protein